MKISVVSGGFDPLHSGHVSYLKEAKVYGEKLIVALNSDDWLIEKKGKFFLPFSERKIILESLKFVDEVIGFEDDKHGSCINALEKIKEIYPKDEIFFCNGGDRNSSNIPEKKLSEIKFVFSVGGDKKQNASSDILKMAREASILFDKKRKEGVIFHLLNAYSEFGKVGYTVLASSKSGVLEYERTLNQALRLIEKE